MALIRFGGGVVDARGSHAGNTFSRNGAGATLKARVAGVNPKSHRQSLARARLHTLANAWGNSLSFGNRTSWRSYAIANPVTNKFGNLVALSGQQMFIRLNGTLMAAGFDPQFNPPAPSGIGSPVTASLIPVHGTGGSVSAAFIKTGTNVDELAYVYMSGTYGNGRSFMGSGFRFLAATVADGTLQDFTSLWVNQFGHLPTTDGGQIFMRWAIINKNDGRISAWIQQSQQWS
jgi:hypothetical protein